MFFLAMHGVERDEMARNIEVFQQFLHGRYLVGLFIDLDMRQHQRRIDGKSAEYLSCFGIVEGVETALERLRAVSVAATASAGSATNSSGEGVRVRPYLPTFLSPPYLPQQGTPRRCALCG